MVERFDVGFGRVEIFHRPDFLLIQNARLRVWSRRCLRQASIAATSAGFARCVFGGKTVEKRREKVSVFQFFFCQSNFFSSPSQFQFFKN